MFIRLFFGFIILIFVITILKVTYFEDKDSDIPPKASVTMDNVAHKVGENTEKINDDILDKGLKFVIRIVDYFKE